MFIYSRRQKVYSMTKRKQRRSNESKMTAKECPLKLWLFLMGEKERRKEGEMDKELLLFPRNRKQM